MDKNTLVQRIRQLLAIDNNAHDIYSNLAEKVKDERLKTIFTAIAQDEKRHIALSHTMLSLLEK